MDQDRIRNLPEGSQVSTFEAGNVSIKMIDCLSGEDPGEGAFAEVGPGVKIGIGSRIGRFTAIGPGAIIGLGSALGTWTTVGPYSRIGKAVRFGAWSSVGMNAVVDSGSHLSDYEYVPSGQRRHLSGKLTPLHVSAEDRELHALYDQWRHADHGDDYLSDQVKSIDAAFKVQTLFRAYLERKDAVASNPFVDVLEKLIGRRLRPVPDQSFFEWTPRIFKPKISDEQWEAMAADKIVDNDEPDPFPYFPERGQP